METTYKPHSHAETIKLPVIPASVSLSASRPHTGFKQFFAGPPANPVSHFSPEAIKVCERRWKVRWDYYNQTFKAEIEQATLADTSYRGLNEHLDRLDSELTRLNGRFTEIDAIKSSAEVATGVQFALTLIEGQNSTIAQLQQKSLGANPSHEQLSEFRRQVKIVDRAYQFALQSSDMVSRMKNMYVLGMRSAKTEEENGPESHEAEGGDRASMDAVSWTSDSPARQSTLETAATEKGRRVEFSDYNTMRFLEGDMAYPPSGSHTVPVATEPNAIPVDLEAGSRLEASASRNETQGGRQRMEDGAGEPPRAATQTLSTAASHRGNLVTLSAVSFFGAGMAWTTVFSGTRGDIVLISWAASCFLIGAVSSACATSLLDADGELLSKYKPVRWAVRMLGVWSMVHAFIGVMLVSAAILVLDPNAGQPSAGTSADDDFRNRDGRVAGGYSLIMCAVVVLVTLGVRQRHVRQTWFI